MKTINLFMAICLLSYIPSNASEITHNKSVIFKMAQGFNAENSQKKAYCLEPSTENIGYSEATIGVVTELSQYHLEESLGMAAGGKFRTGATTTSASADFLRSSSGTGHSLTLIYKADYSFAPISMKEYKWTAIAKDFLHPVKDGLPIPSDSSEFTEEEWEGAVVAKNPDNFLEKCGDEFVDTQVLGAKFYYNIRIDFASKNDMREMGTNFSFSSPTTDVSATFRDKMNKMSSRTKVTISALQIGGSVEKLGAIFGQNLMQDGSNAIGFVACSSGQYEACFTVLQNAIAYANDIDSGFPSTISPSHDTPGRGPAILASYTEKYSEVTGLTNIISPETEMLIKEARRDLSRIFEDLFKIWVTAKRIDETNIPRLSVDQSGVRLASETMAYRDLKDLAVNYIDVCYNDVHKCLNTATEERLERFKVHVTQLEEAIDFKPLRFAALCDKFQGEDLDFDAKQTVAAILKAIDKPQTIGGIEYRPLENSQDYCATAEGLLLETYELDLSNSKIKDLRPLRFASHLTSLNLSENYINSNELANLSLLPNLSVLQLSNNAIKNLNSFPYMKKLSKMLLNGNRLVSTDNFANKVSNLDYLNLSSTGRDVVCPFAPEYGICVMKDYSRYTEFSESLRSSYRRVGSSLVDINGGFILIAGGVGSTMFEIINKQNLTIRELPISAENTHGTSFTRVEENVVFAFGGVEVPGELSAYVMNFSSNGDYLGSEVIEFDGPETYEHKAVRLRNGSILITGGFNTRQTNQSTAAAYLFNPRTYKVEKISGMHLPRANHTMTTLNDGRVLIVGGSTINAQGQSVPMNSIEVYDPNTKKFEWFQDRLLLPRFGHDSITLRDGSVLVTGGFTSPTKVQADRLDVPDSEKATPTRMAELITPEGQVYEVSFKQTAPRAHHKMVLLETGSVALFGGLSYNSSIQQGAKNCYSCIATAEIFDPVREDFTDTGKLMSAGRARFDLLPLGQKRIMILGGSGKAMYSAEIFSYNGL